MNQLFHFPDAVRDDPQVAEWFADHNHSPLGEIAKYWFSFMRNCGDDVNELMHDGYPTACVTDAAFAYVGVFKAHVNVGFYRGAELKDAQGQLQGTGKLMRHVKIRPEKETNASALEALIRSAYQDMQQRIY